MFNLMEMYIFTLILYIENNQNNFIPRNYIYINPLYLNDTRNLEFDVVCKENVLIINTLLNVTSILKLNL